MTPESEWFWQSLGQRDRVIPEVFAPFGTFEKRARLLQRMDSWLSRSDQDDVRTRMFRNALMFRETNRFFGRSDPIPPQLVGSVLFFRAW